uniref:Uncharacterized protein n=1 Tax=candidate division WOR-3 bacterium TaxID=2052148 RepID=A0A7C4U7N0_UNCW3
MKKEILFLMMCLVVFGGETELGIIGGVRNMNNINDREYAYGEMRLYLDLSPDFKFLSSVSGFKEREDIGIIFGWGIEYRAKFIISPYFGFGGYIGYRKPDGYNEIMDRDFGNFMNEGIISYGGYGNIGLRLNLKNFAIILEGRGTLRPVVMEYNGLKAIGFSITYAW